METNLSELFSFDLKVECYPLGIGKIYCNHDLSLCTWQNDIDIHMHVKDKVINLGILFYIPLLHIYVYKPSAYKS